MKRACLINILWVCYLFSANTECKWLLTVSDSASGLGSWIVFSCLCVLLCAALISSILRPFHSSLFSLCLFVRASCTQGRGCVLKASLHSHQGGSLLFNTQTMTCTFSPAWLDGPVPVSVSADQMRYFPRRFFYWMQSSGKILVSPVTTVLAFCVTRPDSIKSSCYHFIFDCEWYIISPAGRHKPLVSFGISIDEPSLEESISEGV